MEEGSRLDLQHDLQQVIASADLCALLSAAFSFPDESLWAGLEDGSFETDARACLKELSFDGDLLEALSVTSHDELRKEYSRLFLIPGKEALIFPYESAFRHVAAGRKGMPSLFITSVTKDVERRMQALGVLPATARTEPVDSLATELDFLRLLYTSLANALHLNEAADAKTWEAEIVDFRKQHVDAWIPDLMKRVRAETRNATYGWLAEFALIALRATIHQ